MERVNKTANDPEREMRSWVQQCLDQANKTQEGLRDPPDQETDEEIREYAVGLSQQRNDKTGVNLDVKFEMSRQCATTRTTTRPFCTGALQRQCLRDATRGCCESGARVRRRQGQPQRQGRLRWFRGPVKSTERNWPSGAH